MHGMLFGAGIIDSTKFSSYLKLKLSKLGDKALSNNVTIYPATSSLS